MPRIGPSILKSVSSAIRLTTTFTAPEKMLRFTKPGSSDTVAPVYTLLYNDGGPTAALRMSLVQFRSERRLCSSCIPFLCISLDRLISNLDRSDCISHVYDQCSALSLSDTRVRKHVPVLISLVLADPRDPQEVTRDSLS
jgi:hypothetical protein